MKILYLIPARRGSKRLAHKNILKLANKPMINYSIDAVLPLLKSNDELCVSTNDKEIIEVVEKNGISVPFIRPDYLSSDTTSTQEVVDHALQWYSNQGIHFDILVLLQPTSPLRTTINIQEALKLWNKEIDMIVSVKKTDANPYFVLFEEDQYGYLQKSKKGEYTRSQDCPKVYEYNGAIYIMSVNSIKNNSFSRKIKYLMAKKNSIDIDDVIDFKLAELLIKEMNSCNENKEK